MTGSERLSCSLRVRETQECCLESLHGGGSEAEGPQAGQEGGGGGVSGQEDSRQEMQEEHRGVSVWILV